MSRLPKVSSLSRIKTRDWALVRIIQGVTKSATHLDRKRESSRLWCRQGQEDEYTGEEGERVEGCDTAHSGNQPPTSPTVESDVTDSGE